MSEIQLFVRYVRREQKQFAAISNNEFENGDFTFGTPPFAIPESEKVKLAKEPHLEMAILRKAPADPLADILKQQYDAILEREKRKGGAGQEPEKMPAK